MVYRVGYLESIMPVDAEHKHNRLIKNKKPLKHIGREKDSEHILETDARRIDVYA